MSITIGSMITIAIHTKTKAPKATNKIGDAIIHIYMGAKFHILLLGDMACVNALPMSIPIPDINREIIRLANL